MSAKLKSLHGHAIPDTSRHSVTVCQPTWADVEAYGNNPVAVGATWTAGYPRLMPHQDLRKLGDIVLRSIDLNDQSCLLFPSLQSALDGFAYAISPDRNDGKDKSPVSPNEISVRAFRAKHRFYALIYPRSKAAVVLMYWKTPGVGISTRFAEANLECIDQLTEIPLDDTETDACFDSDIHKVVQQRIAYHLARAPLDIAQTQPSSEDVYLFPTGMTAIYRPHTYLCKARPGRTALFGMAFLSTLVLFREFGSGYEFFGLGADDDLPRLEDFLKSERSHGRRVQAIWAEFPTNPLLATPDLVRLRALADEYDTILAIDSTISSFANVDILHMVDILTCSLSKSFNGYADILAGCAILNPNSKNYIELKKLFNDNHQPEFYIGEMVVMERNSRDYLERTAKHNKNAAALVDFLGSCAQSPNSCVKKVYYPSVNSSSKHYQQYMRPVTKELTPGYGCVLSVEFKNLPATIAFYDAINLYKSPHLGSPWTLVFAYTVTSYMTRLDWAAQYNMLPTQLRIAPGLEESGLLVEEFSLALDVADRAWQQSMLKSA